jgi:PAS domain S-box-containing protein
LTKEVAERRRAEEALREAERESRLIVDNIPGLVSLLSATGYVEVVNRQLLEYFGQTLEELRHWGTNGTVHPDDLPHVAEVFTRSIKSGSPYNILQRFRRSDGVYRWFENRGFPLRDATGRIVRWCVLLTDVDERKRAEEARASVISRSPSTRCRHWPGRRVRTGPPTSSASTISTSWASPRSR